MKHTLARPADDLEQVMNTYGNMLFRLCIVMLGNSADAEDALQEVMLKYYRKAPTFTDEEHRKAWLLTVAGNQCKDMLRFRTKHMPKEFKPRICPSCHPELFTEDAVLRKNKSVQGLKSISNSSVHETLADKINESKVTHLSDQPRGDDYTRELYDEWWEKLDPDEHEKLRDLGEDPYDPWR